jgi:VIT1/CCC1 family predicted Fe2+/Mn2+ transporter
MVSDYSDHHHRDVTGGAARAAVFGISDGLVTNTSLILGVAGAHPAGNIVRLAGLAGLFAGAWSMAAGEFVSMRAQSELLERELDNERIELARNPLYEQRELARVYERRGMDAAAAFDMAGQMMKDPETALETHAREELGVDPASLGSAHQAALSSLVTCAVGGLVPLMPWFFARGLTAVVATIGLAAALAVGIGLALAYFTGRPRWRTVARQLLVSGVAAAVTYGIGTLVGVSGAT